MPHLTFVPTREVGRVVKRIADPFRRVSVLADLFRLNTLSMIREAGSGHIGSSFSSLDIVTWLWMEELRHPNEKRRAAADIFFSSKGHDAPALYAVLIGAGRLPYRLLHALRKLHGLPGHPDVGTPWMVTNTGPLGMGLSKARGLALARRKGAKGRGGRIVVLCGDGELQEGQIWESLQSASNGGFGELTVIVDCNKIQSDTWTKEVNDLGDLTAKFRSFGWGVARCDGHDVRSLRAALAALERRFPHAPKALIADTVKGKGVSFMERTEEGSGMELYRFHSGAPSIELYERAVAEITGRISVALRKAGVSDIAYDRMPWTPPAASVTGERLVAAYGDELVRLARRQTRIVALDADLMVDCGLLPFRRTFPRRFIECGIAEQDMVSVAGGLALRGKLPVVHSFACFLSARANEQLYNNATERTKIIYIAPLAGVLPAAPGHSHQSVRDISAVGSIPGLTLFEPCNEAETRLALRWAVLKNPTSTYLRLVSVPCEISYSLPPQYTLRRGVGVSLFPGKDAVILAYGPVMLKEAVRAREELLKEGLELAVVNHPWLNAADATYLRAAVTGKKLVVTLDDHYLRFGTGEMLAAEIARLGLSVPVLRMGLSDIPECGQPDEVLTFHRLDGLSIAAAVAGELCGMRKGRRKRKNLSSPKD